MPHKMKIFIVVKKKRDGFWMCASVHSESNIMFPKLKHTRLLLYYLILSEKWFLWWVWNRLFTIDCVYLTDGMYFPNESLSIPPIETEKKKRRKNSSCCYKITISESKRTTQSKEHCLLDGLLFFFYFIKKKIRRLIYPFQIESSDSSVSFFSITFASKMDYKFCL